MTEGIKKLFFKYIAFYLFGDVLCFILDKFGSEFWIDAVSVLMVR